ADTALIETHTSLQTAHVNWNANDPVFSDAPVPDYGELLEREGVFLDYETDGAATSLEDLVNLTKTGGMTVAAAARLTLWAKILIIFDLEDEWKEFKEFEELLKDEFGKDFEKFTKDVKNRKFKKAKKRLKKILKKMTSDKFLDKAAKKLKGKEKAIKKILKKVAGRLGGFLGRIQLAYGIIKAASRQFGRIRA
ncbi:MAG: hypothetical protein AAF368_20390, partial [Planctomycetota bacterium]